MKVVFFVHSLISDWNHGNAHFLRGVCTELIARGHDVVALEPEDAWSLQNLIMAHGEEPIRAFRQTFPELNVRRYNEASLDLGRELRDADLVIVHEWNDPELVAHIGEHRRSSGTFRLLFHDTHHRAITQPDAMVRFDLRNYDGVLAFGEVIRQIYLQREWARSAWTWHEAADVRVFRVLPRQEPEGDLVWIGNWGDEERSDELREFLLDPVRRLGLRARVYGVRYPESALQELAEAGVHCAGWIANYHVPLAFARFRATVHVPRRPYAQALFGIPTIRPFEAMACGIPLVSAPWSDAEGLFSEGEDYLVAQDGRAMTEMLQAVLADESLARRLATHARKTIEQRHTCGHRATELLEICEELGIRTAQSAAA